MSLTIPTPVQTSDLRPPESKALELSRPARLILIAGVDNPSATWLFDICRLIVTARDHESFVGSLEQYETANLANAELVVLRVEEPDEHLAAAAWRIYSMHRDLRDLALRVGPLSLEGDDFRAMLDTVEAQLCTQAFWAARAHLCLGYEESHTDPGEALRVLAHSLGESLSPEQEERLIRQLKDTRAEFGLAARRDSERRSGIVARHGTPKRQGTWIRAVEDGFGWWLEEYGYRKTAGMADAGRWPSAARWGAPRTASGAASPATVLSTPDLAGRRVLVLYELEELEASYRAFSHLSNLHRQLDGAASVASLVLGNYAGPSLPIGCGILGRRELELHRRDHRYTRRLVSLIRRRPSVFRWFSNIDQRREAVIQLLRKKRSPWSDIVLFISDAEFGVDLIEYLFLFVEHLPQHVIAVLPAATTASRTAIERMRYFGVRVLFDASDYGEPTMRFAATGMLRAFDDHLENPLQPRKAPLVNWAGELEISHFQQRRPETILFVHPDWENCGSATTFAKLSRLFRRRGAIQIDLALQPYRMERDCRAVSRKLAKVMASPRPALYFEVGRRWPLELLSRMALSWRSFVSGITTTTEFVMAFYSQCVIPRPVKRLLREIHIDYIYLNHYFTYGVASQVDEKLPLLMDTHDVQSTNFVEHNYPLWLGGPTSSFQDNLEKEIQVMSRANMLTMVSQDEIDLILAQKPDLDIFHYIPIPNVESEPQTASPDFVGPRQIRLLIVASRNPANERSLTWFLRSVWPYVQSPRLILEIVGAIDDYFADQKFPQVRFLGMVDSLQDAYRSADLIILPVTNGGGIAIKTLEAIQYQRAVAATAHAFRGMPADIKAALPLCSDEAQMIQDINLLTQSTEARTAREKIIRDIQQKLAGRNFDGILEERLDRMLRLSESRFRKHPDVCSPAA